MPSKQAELPNLIISPYYSDPYEGRRYCLYDLDKHAPIPRKDGTIRTFTTRSGARGVRWRIQHKS